MNDIIKIGIIQLVILWTGFININIFIDSICSFVCLFCYYYFSHIRYIIICYFFCKFVIPEKIIPRYTLICQSTSPLSITYTNMLLCIYLYLKLTKRTNIHIIIFTDIRSIFEHVQRPFLDLLCIRIMIFVIAYIFGIL